MHPCPRPARAYKPVTFPIPRLIQPDESMNHSNILCDEMDFLYGWSACTTGISGWVRYIPYISKPQLIHDKGGMLRHGAQWPSGTITQPAIAPRQALAQTLLVLSSNPTRNRPSLGRTSFIFSHYRLPDHVSKKLPPTLSHHFLIQHSFLSISRRSRKSPAITSRSPVTEPGLPPPVGHWPPPPGVVPEKMAEDNG